MMYKHLMFEFLPYGASAKILCTKSSKKGPIVTDYESSTSYTTEEQEIGLGGSYFLISNKEPIEMEYEYTKENGILVEIITNFKIIADKNNIRDDGNGHYTIINQDWLRDGNGSFKISNEYWFYNNALEEPYIRLCFNEVKVECCFTNPWSDRKQYRPYCDNGWANLSRNSVEGYDPDDHLIPYSNAAENYCILKRYITVSWNKPEYNLLYKKQKQNDVHWYQIWFSYMNNNGDIIDFSGYKYGTETSVNSFGQQRIMSYDQSAPGDATFDITLPPLNGSGKLNDLTLYNYLKIGYTINFAGESTWQPASTLSINENNYVYDSQGFIYKQTVNSNINSQNCTPTLYSHPSENNWTSNSKFYKTSSGKYVSPSDGLKISSVWTTEIINF